MRACLVGIAVIFAGCAWGQEVTEPRVLVSGDNSYLFGDSRQIASGYVLSLDVSPDGRCVAFNRTILPSIVEALEGKGARPRIVFSIWDSKRNLLWDVRDTDGVPERFQWTKASGIGVSILSRLFKSGNEDRVEITVERLNANVSQRQTLLRVVVSPGTDAGLSPDAQKLLATDATGAGQLIELASGKRTPLAAVPEGANRMFEPDGRLVLIRPKAGDRRGWERLDAVTGVDLGLAPGGEEQRMEPPFDLETSVVKVNGATLRTLQALPLETEETAGQPASGRKQGKLADLLRVDPSLTGPLILDLDPGQHLVSGEGTCVYYSKRGGLYYCPYEKIRSDLLENIVRRRVQNRAMNQAKQVATAMMIYSSDYDDVFPLNSGWEDVVLPYIKDRGMLTGFTYSLNGNVMTSIDNVASTMLGSVDTPYGRAVAYADGHVKWVPGSAPPPLLLLLVADDRRLLTAEARRSEDKFSVEPTPAQ